MAFSTLDDVLWAAGFIGHVALTSVLLVRGRSREFPIFTSFVAYQALTSVLLFLVHAYGIRKGYFLAYWITGFGNYLYQVAVIYEIARDVLRPTGRWVIEARRSFFLWSGLGLVVAVVLASQLGQPQSKGLNLWDARVTVFTAMLTCELFLAMSTAANRLGLQRRSYVVALGLGLTVWACVALVEDFAHAALGWDREFAGLAHVDEIVYLLVLGYWIAVFWLPEKARAPLSPEMRQYLLALHQRVHYDLHGIDGPHG